MKPKNAPGAAKAARQALIISGNRQPYCAAVVVLAVLASPWYHAKPASTIGPSANGRTAMG